MRCRRQAARSGLPSNFSLAPGRFPRTRQPAPYATSGWPPGASFVVNGATPVTDSALVSAGSELRLLDGWLNGWALAARFDGEFASRAQTYAGTGTI